MSRRNIKSIRPFFGEGAVAVFEDAADLNHYWAGFDQGAADMNIIRQPLHENGHTEIAYCRIRERCYDRFYCFNPSLFDLGYRDGADAVAEGVKGEGGCVALIVVGGQSR